MRVSNTIWKHKVVLRLHNTTVHIQGKGYRFQQRIGGGIKYGVLRECHSLPQENLWAAGIVSLLEGAF